MRGLSSLGHFWAPFPLINSIVYEKGPKGGQENSHFGLGVPGLVPSAKPKAPNPNHHNPYSEPQKVGT